MLVVETAAEEQNGVVGEVTHWLGGWLAAVGVLSTLSRSVSSARWKVRTSLMWWMGQKGMPS